MPRKASYLPQVLLLLVAVVLVNLTGQRFGFRLDLTQEGRYTLGKGTVELLDGLQEAVTITAYFTEELPPDLALVRQELKDLLVEYARRSDGMVVFDFIDPNKDEAAEEQALALGIRPLQVSTRQRDKVEQILAYMGAVVTIGDEHALVPVIDGRTLEWTISSAIKQAAMVDKPGLGVVIGHGEARMQDMLQALEALNAQYNVEHYRFWDTMAVHPRFSTLLIVDPKDSFPDIHIHRMDEFLRSGRNVVIAYSAVHGDPSVSPVIDVRRTGLEDWLAERGIFVEPRIVADAQCGNVQVMQQRGAYNMSVMLPFPWFPRITDLERHPITAGLDMVNMRFSTPLSYVGMEDLAFTPLLRTSARTRLFEPPRLIDPQQQWNEADFDRQGIVIGGAWEGDFGDGRNARLVVFTCGDFAVNGPPERAMELPASDVNLLVNAVDWASDATGLIELRTRGAMFRPLRATEPGERQLYKWTGLLLPMAMVVLYGLLHTRWRGRQRKRRMAPIDHLHG